MCLFLQRLITSSGVLLALACAPVLAQGMDDKWILDRVIAGKFDELRAVKAQSDKGSPVAMYWWGAFLDACIYDRCDPQGARALWLKSARAGNSRARLALMSKTRSLPELNELIEKTGAPATSEERARYAAILWILAAFAEPAGRDQGPDAVAISKELAESERRMDAMYSYFNRVGFMRFPDETRAMVEAGLELAAQDLRRLLLINERVEGPQLIARARAGDIVVGVALCETIGIAEGRFVLPPEVLPICERALSLGYTGIASVMLQHHKLSGNPKAAAFYAGLCTTLATRDCASQLADFHFDRSGKSPDWQLWDAVAGISGGFPPNEAGLPTAIMRKVFSVVVRINERERACLARRYDPATKKFGDEPGCPPRKPIAIPAEFLAATRGK